MSLSKLIEAVERGLKSPTTWRDFEVLIPDGDEVSDLPIKAHRAYHGSLDAAKALHDALLPGWFPGLSQNVHDGHWYAWVQTTVECASAFNNNPARAWLLAILRAVEAKGGGK